jgi:hypothetical protein
LLFCFVGFIEANSGGKKTRGTRSSTWAWCCSYSQGMWTMILVLSSQAFCFLETWKPRKQKSAIAIVGRKCCVIQMMMQCYKSKEQSSTVQCESVFFLLVEERIQIVTLFLLLGWNDVLLDKKSSTPNGSCRCSVRWNQSSQREFSRNSQVKFSSSIWGFLC